VSRTGERSAWEAVQQVEDGVALGRVARISRRQIDVDLLTAAAERLARDLDVLDAPSLSHIGGVVWRREAAVEPVVRPVAVDTYESDRDESREDGDRDRRRASAPT